MPKIIRPKLYTRYFNSIIDHGDYYEKRSFKKEKLKQEYEFMASLPAELKGFYPGVHSFAEVSGFASYMIQKIDAIDCSYMLFMDALSSEEGPLKVISKIKDYLNLVPSCSVDREEYQASISREIIQKNENRVIELKALREAAEFNLICSKAGLQNLDQFIKELNQSILKSLTPKSDHRLYFTHGDLCFSNILLANDQLYLIDPKGASDPRHNYRIVHYELAKLSQSLLGNYDLINHELFDFEEDTIRFKTERPKLSKTIEAFTHLINDFGADLQTVRLIEASLFLTLIPFHKESGKKMKAFLINSIHIFKEFR